MTFVISIFKPISTAA